jgi:phosphoribosyl 1,2-cyclic phosphodiesterase
VTVESLRRKSGGTPTYVILDAGTGIRNFGHHALQNVPDDQPLEFHLFITHFHWDHIQGFPFFAPLYRDNTSIHVHGPSGVDVQDLMRGQMTSNYFPITLEDENVRAELTFGNMPADALPIGEFQVLHHHVNHGPSETAAGYRVQSASGSFVYIPDAEPFDYYAGLGQAPNANHREEEAKLLEFVRGADVMIFDTMFTAEDYSKHVGWGHSPAEYALEVAAGAGVKRLGLFHYAPLREDSDIDHLAAMFQEKGEDLGVEVFASREGMVLDIEKVPEAKT